MSGLGVSSNGAEWLRVPGWQNQDWLWHGFSTRRGGVSRAYLAEVENGEEGPDELNLGFTTADSPENVGENRCRFVEAVTARRETPLATVRQVHSNVTVGVSGDSVTGRGAISEADGMITSQAGLLIGIQTADCIPVLVADRRKRVVGAFHAGWRGTVQRIVELGVGRMVREFGSDPADMIAAIGPGIGACCYTVGDEVRKEFAANFSYAAVLFVQNEKELRLNLIEANRRQLLAAGLPAESIATVGGCTGCQSELFYSHRISGGHAGRMMAVIGIR
jgi:YfiH family protein